MKITEYFFLVFTPSFIFILLSIQYYPLNIMMNIAVLAALAGSVTAFAPSPVAQSSKTALNANFSKELGTQMPLGFWDPLGLIADADQDEFDRLCWVELKYGRVAMLAITGYLVTYVGVRRTFPLDSPHWMPSLAWYGLR